MTRTPPVPSGRSRRFTGTRLLALSALAVVGAAGCPRTDEAAPPTTAAVVGTAVTTAVPGTGTTTTAGRAALPEALRGVSEVAGGDPQEVTCITADVGRGLQGVPAADQAGARNRVVGAAVAGCLPPAKVAAAVTQRIQAGALGTPVTGAAVDCIRATLVGAAGDPGYEPFVGAVVAGDASGARQSAAMFDAACGTALASGG